jgi:redox-sensitive bicupin YhaK (pirin superfamily)
MGRRTAALQQSSKNKMPFLWSNAGCHLRFHVLVVVVVAVLLLFVPRTVHSLAPMNALASVTTRLSAQRKSTTSFHRGSSNRNGHSLLQALTRDPTPPQDSTPTTTAAAAAAAATMSQQSSSSISSTTTTFRQLVKVEKFARLPVWPAWNGVLIFLVSRLLGDAVGAQLEDAIGGRVCPNFFNQQQPSSSEDQEEEENVVDVVVNTSPFIMLVHHRHSFFKWDPLRYFQRQFILPEGFPAHPHRGFTTVTYFLKGGFTHRDSMGIQQAYGATPSRHGPYHTQWLSTGAGLLHEEMFDFGKSVRGKKDDEDDWWTDQELYQLWLNVPAREKMTPPVSYLLGDDEEHSESATPRVVTTQQQQQGGKSTTTTETVVLAGTYQGQTSGAPVSPQDVSIFHVTCQPGAIWEFTLPITTSTTTTTTKKKEPYTCILYLRKGSLQVPKDSSGDSPAIVVPVHHTAYFEPIGSSATIRIQADGTTGVDFMLLAGRPLQEPMAAQGSMVMNTADEINVAYRDYQLGRMGRPWDHKLSDQEWQEHIQKYPCVYGRTTTTTTTTTTRSKEELR